MTAKGADPDGGGPKHAGNDPAAPGYPLLFKEPAREERKGFLGWVLGLFRSPRQPDGPEDLEWAREIDELAGRGAAVPPSEVSVAPDRDRPPPTTATPAARSESPNRTPTAVGSEPGAPGQEEAGAAPSPPPPPPVMEERRPTPLHRATLQMLPGRLQPIDRDVLKQEIRFLRPTNSAQEITVGRDAQAPPDHVTLDHPSLAPRHARMQYRDGHWWIESLADDDPVRLNDQAIHRQDGRRLLRDGDRVRLGDLEFRFVAP